MLRHSDLEPVLVKEVSISWYSKILPRQTHTVGGVIVEKVLLRLRERETDLHVITSQIIVYRPSVPFLVDIDSYIACTSLLPFVAFIL